MNNHKSNTLSYKDAGVSIENGNRLIDRLKTATTATHRKGVMTGLGGFGALFDLASLDYRQPVLVSGTDGVGTKIKIAVDAGKHDTIGVDLVAMCVNDLLVQGAEPLFFLDYFACSRLDIDIAETVINGISRGCVESGCALIGGETAEMPGMYKAGDYDLAGFCVGIVERDAIIDGRNVRPGDALIGIASSGPHSNGYSLIRKILSQANMRLDETIDNRTLLEILLQPTRIYVKPLLSLIKKLPVKALAHITGGGLLENVPRVLPKDTSAIIDTSRWISPPIFNWLQEQGNIVTTEMFRTFNCGIGMVVCVSNDHLDEAMRLLQEQGETVWEIGRIENREDNSDQVNLIYK
ncbi:MAG: phosphoribosylformylglycinamidine cyclo-ligase [Gammaproteobacteria bacterium]